MTTITEKPLPFALNVSAIMESTSYSDQGIVAKHLINPVCLNGLTQQVSLHRRQNSLRQLRLENASSTLLRQLAKALQCPTLLVDPQNAQGGFITFDNVLTAHPHMDLQPACCIDFILAPVIEINQITLTAGDGLLRRHDQLFSSTELPAGAVYRNVFYLPVPILTAEEIAAR